MGLIDLLGKVAGRIQEVADRENNRQSYDDNVANAEYDMCNYTLSELIAVAKNYNNNNPSYKRVAAKNLMKKRYNYEL